ncbi:MAG: type II toxin-antitoxin system RelE/ParE family toxin [Clostridia bacterium]|nr:type II toxin-antitoxin system RelE/ParE family toxin [Clostridia bacterium]
MRFVYFETAHKQFCELDISIQKRIKSFTDALQSLENPRSRGKPLLGNLSGFWRYRVGDYRIICKILDEKLVICAFYIAHRKNSYQQTTSIRSIIKRFHQFADSIPVPLDKH